MPDYKPDTQDGIGDMDADTCADPERRQNAGPSGQQKTVARDHREIGAGADDSQDRNGDYG
ncbi:hypothetical protein D9M72_611040 [compost metagenome]